MVTTIASRSRPVADRRSAIGAIDDLIKFRIVEALLRQPDVPVSAAELATQLGFHSVAVTSVELDELVSAKIARSSRIASELRYGLVADRRARAELADMIAQGPRSLLSRLAAGSVSRIKKLLRKTS